ncbi:MAG: hypothetical protein IKB70_10115 [Bacilli bacterium]|nr:hypothetical protein [Bacilli bacterium]
MTIKSFCILILIICVSFTCGVISLAAGKLIALCAGLLLGGAAILAATFTIYLVSQERSLKRTKEELEPIKSTRNKNGKSKRV